MLGPEVASLAVNSMPAHSADVAIQTSDGCLSLALQAQEAMCWPIPAFAHGMQHEQFCT